MIIELQFTSSSGRLFQIGIVQEKKENLKAFLELDNGRILIVPMRVSCSWICNWFDIVFIWDDR